MPPFTQHALPRNHRSRVNVYDAQGAATEQNQETDPHPIGRVFAGRCLGDALGYPIEFASLSNILNRLGPGAPEDLPRDWQTRNHL